MPIFFLIYVKQKRKYQQIHFLDWISRVSRSHTAHGSDSACQLSLPYIALLATARANLIVNSFPWHLCDRHKRKIVALLLYDGVSTNMQSVMFCRFLLKMKKEIYFFICENISGGRNKASLYAVNFLYAIIYYCHLFGFFAYYGEVYMWIYEGRWNL